MERKIGSLDICGHDVSLILTDEVIDVFGKYSVPRTSIWLDANESPSMMQSNLFHEVYEFVLGYYNVTYDPRNYHDSFLKFSNILWEVCKRNTEVLFGSKLMEAISGQRSAVSEEKAES